MASIEIIKGSDGSGNANMATIQNTRSPGATTIDVDTVLGINPAGFAGSMGTPHTFTDPITSETITVISEATAVDFTGHVDGANLEIDDIAPGYTDAGSAVGDIVIIRPTTQYADNAAEVLEAAHKDDGQHQATVNYDPAHNTLETQKWTGVAAAVNELTVKNAATGNDPELQATGGDANVGLNLVPKGTGKIKIAGSLPWRYLGSAKYAAGTVTSVGATPTLVTDLSVEVQVPAGATALRVIVDAPNIYLQSGAGVPTLAVYSGATLGALTTRHSASQPNVPSGAAVPAHTEALILAPAAGSLFLSAAISAAASNAKLDTGATNPALITIEVC